MRSSLLLIALLIGCVPVRLSLCQSPSMKDELDATVKVILTINISKIEIDGSKSETKYIATGSGVVYKKDSGKLGKVHSMILTANHVLDVDTITHDFPVGVTVDSYDFLIKTQTGLVCNLTPVKLGTDFELDDVAIGDADCDAGTVAKVASAVPERGAKIQIIGHPLGVWPALVTEGYVSGWDSEGYLQISATAAPGNSGGPIFYNGEIIGLLTRGNSTYQAISFSPPLKSILERIAAVERN